MTRAPLPERRLLVRCGDALLCLDLTQVREVGAPHAASTPRLSDVLELRGTGPGAVVLVLETGGPALGVVVDGVAGVVEVARDHVLRVPAGTLVRNPALLRGIMRVPEPSSWRGASLLPAPAGQVGMTVVPSGAVALAADLDPVVLGRVLEDAALAHGWSTVPGGRA